MSWVKDAIANNEARGHEKLHQTVFGGYGTKPDIFWEVDPVDMPTKFREGIEEDLVNESTGENNCFILRIETFPAFEDEDLRSTGSPLGCFNVYVGTDTSSTEYTRQINIYEEMEPEPLPPPTRDFSKRATMYWGDEDSSSGALGRGLRKLSVAIGFSDSSDNDPHSPLSPTFSPSSPTDSTMSPPPRSPRRMSAAPTFRKMSIFGSASRRPSQAPPVVNVSALSALEGDLPNAPDMRSLKPRQMSMHNVHRGRQMSMMAPNPASSRMSAYIGNRPAQLSAFAFTPNRNGVSSTQENGKSVMDHQNDTLAALESSRQEDEPGGPSSPGMPGTSLKPRGRRPSSMALAPGDVPKVGGRRSSVLQTNLERELGLGPLPPKVTKSSRTRKTMSMFAVGEEVPGIQVTPIQSLQNNLAHPSGSRPPSRTVNPQSGSSARKDGSSDMHDLLVPSDPLKAEPSSSLQPEPQIGSVRRGRPISMVAPDIPDFGIEEQSEPEEVPPVQPETGSAPPSKSAERKRKTMSMFAENQDVPDIQIVSPLRMHAVDPEFEPPTESKAAARSRKTKSMFTEGRDVPKISLNGLGSIEESRQQSALPTPGERKNKKRSMYLNPREAPAIPEQHSAEHDYDHDHSLHRRAKAAARMLKTRSIHAMGREDSSEGSDLEFSCQGEPDMGGRSTEPTTLHAPPPAQDEPAAEVEDHLSSRQPSVVEDEQPTPAEVDPQMDHYLLPQGASSPDEAQGGDGADNNVVTELTLPPRKESWPGSPVDSKADTFIGTLTDSHIGSQAETHVGSYYERSPSPRAAMRRSPSTQKKIKRMTLKFLGKDAAPDLDALRSADDDHHHPGRSPISPTFYDPTLDGGRSPISPTFFEAKDGGRQYTRRPSKYPEPLKTHRQSALVGGPGGGGGDAGAKKTKGAAAAAAAAGKGVPKSRFRRMLSQIFH